MKSRCSVFLVVAFCASAVAFDLAHPLEGPCGDRKEKANPEPPEDIKVTKAKASTYYGKWKTGALLAKYCNKPRWRLDKKNDRVEFRGVLKKGGAELVVRFQVYYGWVDKSNTRKDWIVVDDSATLAGKAVLVWRPRVFLDESRLMEGDPKGK
jgi:hypothetical protein